MSSTQTAVQNESSATAPWFRGSNPRNPRSKAFLLRARRQASLESLLADFAAAGIAEDEGFEASVEKLVAWAEIERRRQTSRTRMPGERPTMPPSSSTAATSLRLA